MILMRSLPLGAGQEGGKAHRTACVVARGFTRRGRMAGLGKGARSKEQAMPLVNARLIEGSPTLRGTRVTHGGGSTAAITGVTMFRRVAAALGMVIAASLAGI